MNLALFATLTIAGFLFWRAHNRYLRTGEWIARRQKAAFAWAMVGGVLGSFAGVAAFGGAIAGTIPGAIIGYLLASNMMKADIDPRGLRPSSAAAKRTADVEVESDDEDSDEEAVRPAHRNASAEPGEIPTREVNLIEVATTQAGRQPRMTHAIRERDIDLKGYRLSFYRDVSFDGKPTCPQAMVVFDPAAKCRLIVTAEPKLSRLSERISYFLCTWTPEKRSNYGFEHSVENHDRFVECAAVLAARLVFVPDGVEMDGIADGPSQSDMSAVAAGSSSQETDINSAIEWAMDRTKAMEIVSRFGGDMGKAEVREDALRLFPALLREFGDETSASVLLVATKAVRLAIHQWVSSGSNTSSEALAMYLNSLTVND